MTTPITLNAIATDVVGHWQRREEPGRRLSHRLQARPGRRRQPLRQARRAYPSAVVGDKSKARIVAAERRVAGVVGEGVARIAQGYDRGIEFVSGQALKGLEAFAQRTDWAKDMFVVDTVRRINLPAAKLSLKIASRIDDRRAR